MKAFSIKLIKTILVVMSMSLSSVASSQVLEYANTGGGNAQIDTATPYFLQNFSGDTLVLFSNSQEVGRGPVGTVITVKSTSTQPIEITEVRVGNSSSGPVSLKLIGGKTYYLKDTPRLSSTSQSSAHPSGRELPILSLADR